MRIARSIGALIKALAVAWLIGSAIVVGICRGFRGDRPDLRNARAAWLSQLSGRLLRVLGVRVQISGSPPAKGLIISNHLSYLDIMVFSSVVRCAFVSKAEVRNWPAFGTCAALGGSIFVDRTRRSAVAPVSAQMRQALEATVPLVLFAEGTSSGGETVLPFKPALFEPVAGNDYLVIAAAIHYTLRDGSVPDEVCYWRDMTLVPHLWNLLTKREITAFVTFGPTKPRLGDRKAICRELHQEVSALHRAVSVPHRLDS